MAERDGTNGSGNGTNGKRRVPYSEDMGTDIKELPKVSYSNVSSSAPVNLYLNEERNDEPLLILIHGSGFVSGDAAGAAWVCRPAAHLAFSSGAACEEAAEREVWGKI